MTLANLQSKRAWSANSLDAGVVTAGDWYWVPSLPHELAGKHHVPILPTLHSDEGLARPHYNLDTRFLTRRQYYWFIRTNSQVVFCESDQPIQLRLHQCIRALPHTNSYYDGRLYELVESACSDGRTLDLATMKCPHRGIDLRSCPVVDGVVTCPAHGLRWRMLDGGLAKVVRITQPAELRFKPTRTG